MAAIASRNDKGDPVGSPSTGSVMPASGLARAPPSEGQDGTVPALRIEAVPARQCQNG
jgi:hypothetical protein